MTKDNHGKVTFRWRDLEVPLIALLVLLVIGLGITGYVRYDILHGRPVHLPNAVYRTLQTFTLGNDAPEPPIPLSLEAARFLAPFVAVYTAFRALLALFQERLRWLRVRRLRNHVIICGLSRKGISLVRTFCEQGYQVVAIELLKEHTDSAVIREIGAYLITGDARDPALLVKAGILRAKWLVAVTADDGANAEIAMNSRALVKGRPETDLTCIVHIVDPHLWTLLRSREFNLEPDASFNLEFFNTYESGARTLLRESPPFEGCTKEVQQPPSLLLVGLTNMTRSLVVNLARQWRLLHPSSRRKLNLTIVDPDASQGCESISAQFPLVRSVCRLTPVDMKPAQLNLERAGLVRNRTNHARYSKIYICMEDTADCLSTGLMLLDRLRHACVEIIVVLLEASGLVTMLEGVAAPHAGEASLRPFALLEKTCRPGLFDDGTHETLGRAIHAAYCEDEQQKGETPATNPRLCEWNMLIEEYRRSNVRQGEHLGVHLARIGSAIAPWTADGAQVFQFTPQEEELIAALEHNRWKAEREEKGWRYGLQRDNRQKLHPGLLSYDDARLNEEYRQMTRATVRKIPNYLARAGFQIIRQQ